MPFRPARSANLTSRSATARCTGADSVYDSFRRTNRRGRACPVPRRTRVAPRATTSVAPTATPRRFAKRTVGDGLVPSRAEPAAPRATTSVAPTASPRRFARRTVGDGLVPSRAEPASPRGRRQASPLRRPRDVSQTDRRGRACPVPRRTRVAPRATTSVAPTASPRRTRRLAGDDKRRPCDQLCRVSVSALALANSASLSYASRMAKCGRVWPTRLLTGSTDGAVARDRCAAAPVVANGVGAKTR